MKTRTLFGAAGLATAGIAAALVLASPGPAAAHDPQAGAETETEAAGERLGARIQSALRESGPFFTAEERAVIEQACGYSAGSWDGFEANMSDGDFVCRDGRRVDSPELRRVMEAAGPRIGRRVSEVMARADIEGEIARISRVAADAAMRSVDHAAMARRVSLQVERQMRDIEPRIRAALNDPETRRALREAEAAAERAGREAERAIEESQRARRR